jgi:diacylglycerol kinase (ATP)
MKQKLSMKFAKLLHNPSAGEGQFTKKDLIALIQSAGFGCSYSSTKKDGWEKIDAKQTDFIVLAGGDGTVRRVAASLLQKKLIDRRFPIALIPMGTANNIAKTLGILDTDPQELAKSWDEKHLKKFDVGRIFGIKRTPFFLESFGFGVFPDLMKKMKKRGSEKERTPEQNLETALTLLRQLIERAQAKYCRISIDGVHHHGNYLLVEIMNTSSIGPQLKLAPLADPADGHFDVIMISEKQRDEFIDYVDKLLLGREEKAFFNLLRAKKLEIFWDGTRAHVDDEIVTIKKDASIDVELRHGLLEFLVPENTKDH